jgi:hypothetical protein
MFDASEKLPFPPPKFVLRNISYVRLRNLFMPMQINLDLRVLNLRDFKCRLFLERTSQRKGNWSITRSKSTSLSHRNYNVIKITKSLCSWFILPDNQKYVLISNTFKHSHVQALYIQWNELSWPTYFLPKVWLLKENHPQFTSHSW